MPRRLFIALTLLGLLAVGSPAAHAGARVDHTAHAVFVLPERGGVHPAIFVSAVRMSGVTSLAPSVGSLNIGFTIHHGECSAPDDLDSCVITDRSRSVGGNFRDGDVFEIDTDLGYAHMKVTRRGVTHEVTWRATTAPSPVASDTECGPAAAGAVIGFEPLGVGDGNGLRQTPQQGAGPGGRPVYGRLHLLTFARQPQ